MACLWKTSRQPLFILLSTFTALLLAKRVCAATRRGQLLLSYVAEKQEPKTCSLMRSARKLSETTLKIGDEYFFWYCTTFQTEMFFFFNFNYFFIFLFYFKGHRNVLGVQHSHRFTSFQERSRNEIELHVAYWMISVAEKFAPVCVNI